MKTVLLLGIVIIASNLVVGQTYYITSGTWSNESKGNEEIGYVEAALTGNVLRNRNVRYNHHASIFLTSSNNWTTQFNNPLEFPPPDPGTNADYFLYQGPSEIRGDGGSLLVFDTLYLNNGAGNSFTVNNRNNASVEYWNPPGAISIYSRLYFNNGITTTNRQYPLTGAIVFVNSANYVGGLADAQHINGFVSEYNFPVNNSVPGHSGDFTFPIGNASSVYQLRRQGVFDDFDNVIVTGWVDGDPNTVADPTGGINNTSPSYLGTGVIAVSPVGFWDWHIQDVSETVLTPRSLPNAQTITVSIPDLTYLSSLSASDLRLVGFNTATNKWEDLSGGANASGLTKGSTLSGIIPANKTIRALAIGATSLVLPVQFAGFSVKGNGCSVNLEWQTGTEQNNSHFVVERSSNGREFTTIARVASAGNSNTSHSYQYTDAAPVTGTTNYYRITQVDFDGAHTSTDVKPIKMHCNGAEVAVRVYPNPVTSQVNVQTSKAVTQINLLSMNGQAVLKYTPSSVTGGTFSLNMHSVQNGIYLLQVINKDGTTDAIKLIKQ